MIERGAVPQAGIDELGSFLRGRCQLLTPQEAGIPLRRRRRTPGLRREEVADLAGISPDWYTRIELGAGATPSAATLKSIAVALRLSPIDTEYLFELAGLSMPKAPQVDRPPAVDPIERLVRSFDPARAAAVVGDVFGTPRCWNESADAIFRWSSCPDALHRNVVVGAITDPYYRELFGDDFEDVVRVGVGMFRRAFTTLEPTPLAQRVYDYVRHDPLFAEMWNQHTVSANYSPAGPFYRFVPGVGRIQLTFADWQSVGTNGLIMRVLTPHDAAAVAGFAQLATMGTASGYLSDDD